MNLSKRNMLASIAAVALLSTGMQAQAQHQYKDAKNGATSTKTEQTGAALRDLWVGHVFWVRNVVLATSVGNAAEASAAENEVVANAKQIAAAIEPFYGKPASEKLFSLLAGHYGAVKQYLEAALADSKPKQELAMKALTDNAGEIAIFLSGANPYLPLDTLRSLLLAHVGHHVLEIQQWHNKQYAEEAKTWEAMKNHMYVIADALTGALAKQFPAKFQ
ncbi:hypothetical protein [Herminiimonas sp. CN]|uniref:hypothetical protein n=1 Tax=Herminiimonas sp. CN TaxID=1349818 RepID=UPI0004741769|nr:hypothetical protein [Herminiimonas sp. CN]